MVSVSSAVSNAATDGAADAQQHKRQRAARESAGDDTRMRGIYKKKKPTPVKGLAKSSTVEP